MSVKQSNGRIAFQSNADKVESSEISPGTIILDFKKNNTLLLRKDSGVVTPEPKAVEEVVTINNSQDFNSSTGNLHIQVEGLYFKDGSEKTLTYSLMVNGVSFGISGSSVYIPLSVMEGFKLTNSVVLITYADGVEVAQDTWSVSLSPEYIYSKSYYTMSQKLSYKGSISYPVPSNRGDKMFVVSWVKASSTASVYLYIYNKTSNGNWVYWGAHTLQTYLSVSNSRAYCLSDVVAVSTPYISGQWHSGKILVLMTFANVGTGSSSSYYTDIDVVAALVNTSDNSVVTGYKQDIDSGYHNSGTGVIVMNQSLAAFQTWVGRGHNATAAKINIGLSYNGSTLSVTSGYAGMGSIESEGTPLASLDINRWQDTGYSPDYEHYQMAHLAGKTYIKYKFGCVVCEYGASSYIGQDLTAPAPHLNSAVNAFMYFRNFGSGSTAYSAIYDTRGGVVCYFRKLYLGGNLVSTNGVRLIGTLLTDVDGVLAGYGLVVYGGNMTPCMLQTHNGELVAHALAPLGVNYPQPNIAFTQRTPISKPNFYGAVTFHSDVEAWEAVGYSQ